MGYASKRAHALHILMAVASQSLRRAELERLSGFPRLDRRHCAIVLTAYAPGLKASEVCHLRVPDLLSGRSRQKVVRTAMPSLQRSTGSPRLWAYFRAASAGLGISSASCHP